MIPLLLILAMAACSRAASPVLSGPNAMQESREPAVSEEEVKRVSAVKDRHADSLMRLPAVAGVAVGASERRPGKAAIQIYLSRELSKRERRRFPTEIEGAAVELQVTGTFKARPAAKDRR